jgi:hypothetical protein
MLLNIAILLRAPSPITRRIMETMKHGIGHERKGRVLAYTIDGDTNVILEQAHAYYVWRMDRQTGLLLSGMDGMFVFHRVTRDRVYPITPLMEESLLVEREVFWPRSLALVAQYPPYIILSSPYSSDTIWLADLDHNTIEALNENVDIAFPCSYDQCLRFSGDGRSLRYITEWETETGATWALRERILDTGEERIVYSQPARPMESCADLCQPDTYGERYLHTTVEYDRALSDSYWFLYITGTTELIIEENGYVSMHSNIFLSRENMVIIDVLCEENCTIEVYPAGSSTPRLYAIPSGYPPSRFPHFDYIEVLDEDRVLVFRNFDRYIFSNTDDPIELGAIACCPSRNDHLENGRWLLVGKRVWDVMKESVALRRTTQLFSRLSRQWLYCCQLGLPYVEDTAIELPIAHGPNRKFYEIDQTAQSMTSM